MTPDIERCSRRARELMTPERIGLERHLFDDLYHRLLSASWPQLLMLVAVSFLMLNLVFAGLYEADGPCLEGLEQGRYVDVFFFSVQQMATIGSAKVAPKTRYANLLITAEATCGLLMFPMITGLFFAKFSRPTARVLFSKAAVIYPADGLPTLMFRMANERANRIVEAQCRVMLVRRETAHDGEEIRRLYDLGLRRSMNPLFALTWTAMHPIDETSPLHGETVQSMAESDTLIIVSLVGIDETFSATIHDRHVYNAQEVVFDRRLADVMTTRPDGTLAVDYTRFHDLA